MAEQPSKSTVSALTAIAIALGLGLVFFYAYAGALHEPKPNRVPFAVIAPEPEASRIADRLATAGQALAPRAVPDKATAIEQLKERSISGAIEPGNPSHLFIASAGSAIAAQIISQAATEVAAKDDVKLVTTDIVPLPARDPDGLIPFYLVVAGVVAGYLAAVLSASALGTTRFPFRAALRHLALFLGFALAFAILVMVIAGPVMNAVSGNFWALASVMALIVATSSAVTLALLAAFGQLLGFLCAITLLILLGNSSSGGASPRDFMPGFWRELNSVLPNAAGVNGMTDIAYFPAVSLTRPLLTLAAWLVGGVLVFLALRPRDTAPARSQSNLDQAGKHHLTPDAGEAGASGR